MTVPTAAGRHGGDAPAARAVMKAVPGSRKSLFATRPAGGGDRGDSNLAGAEEV